MTFIVSRIQSQILANGQTAWREIEEMVEADSYSNASGMIAFHKTIHGGKGQEDGRQMVCFYPLTEIKKVRVVSEQ